MTNIEAAISELEIEGYSDEEIASIVVSWIVDLYED